MTVGIVSFHLGVIVILVIHHQTCHITFAVYRYSLAAVQPTPSARKRYAVKKSILTGGKSFRDYRLRSFGFCDMEFQDRTQPAVIFGGRNFGFQVPGTHRCVFRKFTVSSVLRTAVSELYGTECCLCSGRRSGSVGDICNRRCFRPCIFSDRDGKGFFRGCGGVVGVAVQDGNNFIFSDMNRSIGQRNPFGAVVLLPLEPDVFGASCFLNFRNNRRFAVVSFVQRLCENYKCAFCLGNGKRNDCRKSRIIRCFCYFCFQIPGACMGRRRCLKRAVLGRSIGKNDFAIFCLTCRCRSGLSERPAFDGRRGNPFIGLLGTDSKCASVPDKIQGFRCSGSAGERYRMVCRLRNKIECSTGRHSGE